MTSSGDALRIAAVGLDHPHVFGMAHALVAAGAELAMFHPGETKSGETGSGETGETGSEPGNCGEPGRSAETGESPLVAIFARAHPGAQRAREVQEILEDESIALVLCAGVNADRAPLGVRVMRHGKDFVVDKPGCTTLEQLAEVRRVQAETGRMYSVCYSERFESRATVRASELVAQGAIGRVLQTVGLGPHRIGVKSRRPAWFYQRERYGGILTDLASHQMDQFLHFTGLTGAPGAEARVVSSAVGNLAHPETPELEDFGEALLQGDGCTGYVRVDWFTPDGLESWGDGRLFVLGSEGTLEVRKNVDPAGRAEGNHLFVVDGKETRYVDCRETPLPWGAQILADVVDRTQTAMSQEHCFRASELALRAEAGARRLGRAAP